MLYGYEGGNSSFLRMTLLLEGKGADHGNLCCLGLLVTPEGEPVVGGFCIG